MQVLSGHVIVPDFGYIGGPHSEYAGPRRHVPACSNLQCTLFKDDDGTYASLLGPEAPVPLRCPGAPPPPAEPVRHIPENPRDWDRQQWADLLLAFRVLSPMELEIFRLREEMASPTRAPRSFAELMRSGDSASGLRTISGLFETVARIARNFRDGAVIGQEQNAALNDTAVKILDDEGARVITERLAAFAKIRGRRSPHL